MNTLSIGEIKILTKKLSKVDINEAFKCYCSLDNEAKAQYMTGFKNYSFDKFISYTELTLSKLYFFGFTGATAIDITKVHSDNIDNIIAKLDIPSNNKFITDDNGKLLSVKEFTDECTDFIKSYMKDLIYISLDKDIEDIKINVLVDCNISDRILDFDSVHSSIKEILMLKIF
jgi:hypothetical protein